MKATGVVRRIDELGRIVIPKEIRKNLKIKSMDEIEVFVDGENIILKKFSALDDYIGVMRRIIDVVSGVINKTILVSDLDKYIVGSGSFSSNYVLKDISSFVREAIVGREICISNDEVMVDLGLGVSRCAYIIYPIINYGDVFGAVVLVSDGTISNDDRLLINMISQFLSKCVEE